MNVFLLSAEFLKVGQLNKNIAKLHLSNYFIVKFIYFLSLSPNNSPRINFYTIKILQYYSISLFY